ncbi:MAG: hypothetical protein AB4062_10315 [Crocosphaera sp.]
MAFIINTVLQWRKLKQTHLSDETDDKTQNKLFSKQWYLDNLSAIIIMIISISLMITSLIILTIIGYWNTTYIISDPKFEIINDGSSILLAVSCLLYSLERVERVKSFLDNKFFRSLKIIMIFSAFLWSIIYASNLTEVP